MPKLHHLKYKAYRFLIKALITPSATGTPPDTGKNIIYVFNGTSEKDLLVLEAIAEKNNLSKPMDIFHVTETNQLTRLIDKKKITLEWPDLALRSSPLPDPPFGTNEAEVKIIPIVVFWGRQLTKGREKARQKNRRNIIERIKDLVEIYFYRRDVYLHFGSPLSMEGSRPEIIRNFLESNQMGIKLNHGFYRQRIATVGPNFRSKREVVRRVLKSKIVKRTIDRFAFRSGRKTQRGISTNLPTSRAFKRIRAFYIRLGTQYMARRAIKKTAANMSYLTIRVLERILSWFWRRIFKNIEINGLDKVKALAETHTLLYTPSHRSHLDYLLLSCILHDEGLMMPHIAAGENMNLPLIGHLLRQGGAFFMRRSFREDPIYSAIFSEYLYETYKRGHSVEFFPEGGRSRTGKLLPARLGLIKTTIEHQKRGLPRSISIIPIYFGYEKLVEENSYLSELKGAKKRNESIKDLIGAIRLLRKKFGSVVVNFGDPIDLKKWITEQEANNNSGNPQKLGRAILEGINEVAAINPINLVATSILPQKNGVIATDLLSKKIAFYSRLLKADDSFAKLTITKLTPMESIHHAVDLEFIQEKSRDGVILIDEPAAERMAWYRNNTIHTLVIPALISLLIRSEKVKTKDNLHHFLTDWLGYIETEFHIKATNKIIDNWLNNMVSQRLFSWDKSDSIVLPTEHSPESQYLRDLSELIADPLRRILLILDVLFREKKLPLHDLEKIYEKETTELINKNSYSTFSYFDKYSFERLIDYLVDNEIISRLKNGNILKVERNDSSIFKLL